jgi:hypothetical protein
MSEKIAFNPRVSLPFGYDKDGNKRARETQARLTFPDIETAVKFLNTGAARGLPITVEGIKQQNETNTGPHNEYDAWVFRPDSETGEVGVMMRRYVFGDTLASAALSDFIVETTQQVLEAESPEAIQQ